MPRSYHVRNDTGHEYHKFEDAEVRLDKGRRMSDQIWHETFFPGDVGATLPPPYVVTGSTGNTDPDFLGGLGFGYELLHSTDSEAQIIRLDFGDTLALDLFKNPTLEFGFILAPTGATYTADQRVALGFASAYNATLDSVAKNAWLRVDGANLDILAEVDDGTTDDDDNDTAIDAVKGQLHHAKIEVVNNATAGKDVKFYVDGVLGSTLTMAAVTSSTPVQPMYIIQRDAGAEADNLKIMYSKFTQDR